MDEVHIKMIKLVMDQCEDPDNLLEDMCRILFEEDYCLEDIINTSTKVDKKYQLDQINNRLYDLRQVLNENVLEYVDISTWNNPWEVDKQEIIKDWWRDILRRPSGYLRLIEVLYEVEDDIRKIVVACTHRKPALLFGDGDTYHFILKLSKDIGTISFTKQGMKEECVCFHCEDVIDLDLKEFGVEEQLIDYMRATLFLFATRVNHYDETFNKHFFKNVPL